MTAASSSPPADCPAWRGSRSERSISSTRSRTSS